MPEPQRPQSPAPRGAWWHNAVFYEIYVRSFADSDGDGLGDLNGIRTRLPYLASLGVDALWLTPFYPSPQVDHGYDVADYCDVDPRFGTLADFDALLSEAHALGLRVTVDIVPNHTSDAHPWFRQALADGPGAASRERYFFRAPKPGGTPPNNWHSTFGGSAWSAAGDGEVYLHLFAPEQPDLDWRHPDVPVEFERILRFWLDRGVDGFRIDVAHGLFKREGLPDAADGPLDLMADVAPDMPMWNQPEVHEVYRSWRRLAEGYAGERVFVGEVWLGDPWAQASYVRADELHMAFNFRLLKAPWRAAALREAIDRSLVALGEVGSPSTWVLSNHDVARHVTRYGGGERGLRRAHAALLLLLALPGPVFLYQGEELGLGDVDVPDVDKQDPQWFRSGGRKPSRDGCRVPLPWSGERSPFGFSPNRVRPWLPMPATWAAVTVERQQDDPRSTLELYRRALACRRVEPALNGSPMRWCDGPTEALVFERGLEHERLVCAVNMGATPLRLPAGQLLLTSDGLSADGALPPDTAAWLRAG